jgi:hypothetical protein
VSIGAETLGQLAALRDELPEPAAAPVATRRRRKRSTGGTVLRRGVEGYSAGTPVQVLAGLDDGAVLVAPLAVPDQELRVSVWDLVARRRGSSPPRQPAAEAAAPPEEEAPAPPAEPPAPVSVGTHGKVLVFASRSAVEQWARLGGQGCLETVVAEAICQGASRSYGGTTPRTKSVWLPGINVRCVQVVSPLRGRKAWRIITVQRHRSLRGVGR